MDIDKKIVVFGEVLFDRFPNGQTVIGGAPFNVAWNLKSFGAEPLFVSGIGDDEMGEKVLQHMNERDMCLDGIQTHNVHPTGRVEVSFSGNEPSYDIMNNCAYDFIDTSELPEIHSNSYVYHGTLALRNGLSENSLQNIVKNSPSSVFTDVNLRKPWYDTAKVIELLKKARWIKLSEDELNVLVPGDNILTDKLNYLFDFLKPELITITLGKRGVIGLTANMELFEIPAKPVDKVVDSVGAGDAFSSVLLLGLIKNWNIAVSIERAQDFARSVIGIRGAITTEKSFYETTIKQWN